MQAGSTAGSNKLGANRLQGLPLGLCSLVAGTLSLCSQLRVSTLLPRELPAVRLRFSFFFFLRHSTYQHKGHGIIAPALLSMIPEAFAGSPFHPLFSAASLF